MSLHAATADHLLFPLQLQLGEKGTAFTCLVNLDNNKETLRLGRIEQDASGGLLCASIRFIASGS